VLKHFLKDGLGSSDPTSRSTAVARLDASNPENQQKLIEIANGDSDEQVRCAAIERLTDIPTLAALSANSATAASESNRSQTVISASLIRLEALIVAADESDQGVVIDAQLADLLTTAHTDAAVLIACHYHSEELRQRALAHLTEVENLVSVVIDSRFHATRADAAARLKSVASMETALMGIKTRDKVVARSLQLRINEIVDGEKKAAAHQQDIDQLINSTQSLAASVWSPQYAARLTALNERWDRLDPSPSDQQQVIFEKARSASEVLVIEHQQQDQALRFCHDAVVELDQLITEMTTTSLPELSAKLGEIRQRYTSTNASWRISEAAIEAPAALISQQKKSDVTLKALLSDFEQVAPIANSTGKTQPSDVNAQLKTLTTVLSSTSAAAFAEAPAYVELADVQKKLQTSLRVQRDENIAKIKSVQKQLAGTAAAIGEKRWSQANSLFGRAQKKLDKLKGLPEYKGLSEKLSSHEKKLQELGDWVDFAARPKLTTLCEQMEALPDKGMSPKELAPAIKTLQEQWKSVGMGPCSNELWPRFKTAGDKAFEPCAVYFAGRTAERTARTDNKQKICDQLDTYLEAMDWEAADWKTVEKTLRVAKNEWRNNRVTDRKPDKALEKRFTDLVSRFNEKLSAQYDLNAEIKAGFIEKAKALSEAEVSQHVVNQTRRLQSSWKQTGIMRRKQDQLLWEEFNGFCRQIHRSHRDVEKAKSDSGLAHVKTAREIIKKLRSLARAGEPDEKTFNALQDQFNALAEFPERDRKFLFRDFNQASEQFSRLRDSSSARHAQSEMQELRRKSELCGRYEALVGAEVADTEVAAIDAEWDDETTSLPRDWNKKIQARRKVALGHLEKKSAYDFQKTDRARRMLCIQAEILTETETPAEDRSLRMEYQLEALQQGLGQNSLTGKKEELHALLVEWLTLAPASAEQRDRLELRFQATCK